MSLLKSFIAAIHGIRQAVTAQRNIKIQIGAALLVIAVGIYVDLGPVDWCLVVLAIGMVLSSELMNSAVETLVDLVEPRQHPLAGRAKDIAAGSVLVAAIAAVVIGFLVFGKYIPWP